MENELTIENLLKKVDKNNWLKLYLHQNYNGKIDFSELKYVSKYIDEFISNGIKGVYLTTNNERVSKEIFIELCELYKSIGEKIGCKVCVYHNFDTDDFSDNELLKWDIKTIIDANTDIDRVCEFIKKSKFSQLEALAFIHNYVGHIAKYQPSHDLIHNWCDKDQFFAGIYEKIPQVVCMGYSSLMKEIIDNLNMPGLECDVACIKYEKSGSDYRGGHARCYLKVKDDKYGIEQSCFDDPTWDGRQSGDEKNWSFAHFAMSNKCHNYEKNDLYCYNKPIFQKMDKNGNITKEENYNSKVHEYDVGKNELNQETIEKIYFNVLQKSRKDLDFDGLYNELSQITKNSFNKQTKNKYKGYLESEDMKLSYEDAQKIYVQNLPKRKSEITQKTNNEKVM